MRKVPLPEQPVNRGTYQCVGNPECPFFENVVNIQYPTHYQEEKSGRFAIAFFVVHPTCYGCGFEMKKVVSRG